MKRFLIAGVAAGLVLGLAGCGEQSQVTVYKQGQYQGKPDKQPWDNAQFKNDRAAWDNAIKARSSGQDEYPRVAGK
jgi:hypothetical protein